MKVKLIILAMILALAVAGCKGQGAEVAPGKKALSQEERAALQERGKAVREEARTIEHALMKAVMDYNAELVRGYESLNVNSLIKVASAEQTHDVYKHMFALGQGDWKLLAELKEIRFKEFGLAGEGTAVARVSETWDYRHVSIKGGEVVRDEKDVKYDITYRLRTRDGVWIVDDVIDEALGQDGGQAGQAPKRPSPPDKSKEEGN